MHRVLLINGPPGAGKDAAAHAITIAHNHIHRERFSDPLKNSICSWIGVIRGSEHEAWLERNKEIPAQALAGLSYREAQIDLSEKYLKPLYGNDCFGRWMYDRLVYLHELHDRIKQDTFTVIPDSGFSNEAEPLLALSNTKLALMQVHRPGHDFSKDSRSYIELPGVHTFALYNNGTLPDYQGKVIDAVQDWIRLTP